MVNSYLWMATVGDVANQNSTAALTTTVARNHCTAMMESVPSVERRVPASATRAKRAKMAWFPTRMTSVIVEASTRTAVMGTAMTTILCVRETADLNSDSANPVEADTRPAALARSVIQTPLSASQLNQQSLGVVHLVEERMEMTTRSAVQINTAMANGRARTTADVHHVAKSTR